MVPGDRVAQPTVRLRGVFEKEAGRSRPFTTQRAKGRDRAKIKSSHFPSGQSGGGGVSAPIVDIQSREATISGLRGGDRLKETRYRRSSSGDTIPPCSVPLTRVARKYVFGICVGLRNPQNSEHVTVPRDPGLWSSATFRPRLSIEAVVVV